MQETIIAYTNCLERGEKGILSLKVNVDWFSLTCNTSGGVRRHCWQLRDNYPAADNMVRKHGGGPGETVVIAAPSPADIMDRQYRTAVPYFTM